MAKGYMSITMECCTVSFRSCCFIYYFQHSLAGLLEANPLFCGNNLKNILQNCTINYILLYAMSRRKKKGREPNNATRLAEQVGELGLIFCLVSEARRNLVSLDPTVAISFIVDKFFVFEVSVFATVYGRCIV
ncbi:hypothetical protein ACOSQ2_011727 [Xanthoceras sorbifolium]